MTTPDLTLIRDRLRRSVAAQRLLRGLTARAARDTELEPSGPPDLTLTVESEAIDIGGSDDE